MNMLFIIISTKKIRRKYPTTRVKFWRKKPFPLAAMVTKKLVCSKYELHKPRKGIIRWIPQGVHVSLLQTEKQKPRRGSKMDFLLHLLLRRMHVPDILNCFLSPLRDCFICSFLDNKISIYVGNN